MLTDLIDDFIGRARLHVDAHPVRCAFAEPDIELTIRVMERLREHCSTSGNGRRRSAISSGRADCGAKSKRRSWRRGATDRSWPAALRGHSAACHPCGRRSCAHGQPDAPS